jgi:hypothetical protein
MEVDDAAPLVFSNLGERDPDLGRKCSVGEPRLAGQSTAQGHREAAPQFGRAGVEKHRAGVVVAVRAQRLPEQRIIPRVPGGARQPDAVRADFTAPTGPTPQEPTVFLPIDMHRTERWRRERGEHARMLGNGGGQALAAAEPGSDHLVGVGAVVLGTGRAAGSAAGLAGDRQDAAGLVDDGVTVEQFAGSPVDVVNAAAQQNWLPTTARVSGDACSWISGQGWSPLVVPLRAG